MIVLVGDTRSHKNVALLKGLGWGRMRVTNMTRPFEGEPWALDNGAFGAWRNNRPFDDVGFRKRVAKALTMPAPFMCVLPDIVAGGLKSLALSIRWLDELPVELPWYLVVQDGMTPADVEPHLVRVAGLFLGGTDAFKPTARQWADLAHAHGKLFHFGRAGSVPKIEMALASGCDSLDSCFPLWTNERMGLFERLLSGGTLTDAERAVYHRRGARRTGRRAPHGQLAFDMKTTGN
jgi:hypothetical protein